MEAVQFYNLTKKTLYELADLYEIQDPSRYFKQTDFDEDSIIQKLNVDIKDNNGLNFTFAQVCFHMQNTAHGIGPFLEIKKYYEEIKKCFCDFDVYRFKQLNDNDLKQISITLIHHIVDDRDKHRKMTKKEIKQKKYNPDIYYRKRSVYPYFKLMNTFANNLIKTYKSRSEFIDSLIKSKSNNEGRFEGPLNIIKALLRKGKNNYAALMFDLVKEISSTNEFDYFCKPDGHLIDIFNKLFGKESFHNNLDYVIKMEKIMNELHIDSNYYNVTTYSFDRMLYIICSENFFLDNIESTKGWFLSKI